MYASIIAKRGDHLEVGAKLLIKTRWLEKPPQSRIEIGKVYSLSVEKKDHS
jgi:hypothetical protein